MTQNTTEISLIQPGDKFTAFDLYNMADVLPDHMLYGSCVQYCVFLGWHDDLDDTVRILDTAGSEFWTTVDSVTVMANGWIIPDMRSSDFVQAVA